MLSSQLCPANLFSGGDFFFLFACIVVTNIFNKIMVSVRLVWTETKLCTNGRSPTCVGGKSYAEIFVRIETFMLACVKVLKMLFYNTCNAATHGRVTEKEIMLSTLG